MRVYAERHSFDTASGTWNIPRTLSLFLFSAHIAAVDSEFLSWEVST